MEVSRLIQNLKFCINDVQLEPAERINAANEVCEIALKLNEKLQNLGSTTKEFNKSLEIGLEFLV